MGGSDTTWRTWGERDPYFGVLTDTKFRKENIAANLSDFHRTGEDYVNERLGAARRHFGFEPGERALDFGCGVGRLALPMASRFKEIVGVDVSDAMLKEAQKNATRMGVGNVSFVQSDDQLSRVQGEFDMVNSYITLQHIPVKRGLAIIDLMLQMVRPGGVAALHFSIERRESLLQRAKYIAQFQIPGAATIVGILRRNPTNEPAMEMNEYPLVTILSRASKFGFGPALIETENHGRILTAKMLTQRLRQ